MIARFQEHIAAREIDLQLIQKQMEEQVGERRYDKVPRGCSPVSAVDFPYCFTVKDAT